MILFYLLFSDTKQQRSGSDEEEQKDESLIQSGSGLLSRKRKYSEDDDEYISKIATLVSQKIQNPLLNARPVNTAWTNYNLSLPSTSVAQSANTTPPVHYDVKKFQNDDNDSFDEQRLLKLVPAQHKKLAKVLLDEFNNRGTELTWNSDGVIFKDQTSIPQSNIFELFPYLFKHKHPKSLTGFEDFVEKIDQMGLSHLIVKSISKPVNLKAKTETETSSSKNFWFLG